MDYNAPAWMPEWLYWLLVYLQVLILTPIGWFFLGMGLIVFGWLYDRWKYRRRS